MEEVVSFAPFLEPLDFLTVQILTGKQSTLTETEKSQKMSLLRTPSKVASSRKCSKIENIDKYLNVFLKYMEQ